MCLIDVPAMPVLIVPDPTAGAGAECFEPVRLNLDPELVAVTALVAVPVGPRLPNVNPDPVLLVAVVFGAKLKAGAVVTAAGTVVFGAKLYAGGAVTGGCPAAACGAGVDWLNGLVKPNVDGVSGTEAIKTKRIVSNVHASHLFGLTYFAYFSIIFSNKIPVLENALSFFRLHLFPCFMCKTFKCN